MVDGKRSIYIETTIVSYITSNRLSKRPLVAIGQQASKYFWEHERQNFELFTSKYVDNECGKGDPEAARRRLELIKNIERLPETDDVIRLAEIYFDLLDIPKKSQMDSLHIAICVVHNIDYLLSSNFTHIGHESEIKLRIYNMERGLYCPRLVSAYDILRILEDERHGLA